MNNKISQATLKKFSKLKEKKYRDIFNLHIVEGLKNNLELIKRNIYPVYLLTSDKNFHNIKQFEPFTNICYLSYNEFKKISDTKTPQDCAGIYNNKIQSISSLDFDVINNFILLDNIQDPKNLGVIIRLAVAFNIDAMFLTDDSVDIYNPKVIRSSAGLHSAIPVVYIKHIDELIEIKNKHKIFFIGADLAGKNFKNYKFNKSKKMIVFGNEGQGLSQKIKNIIDEFIKIEMKNNVESLNIATAASIILWELSK